jgi:LacI family transcriptional regulator
VDVHIFSIKSEGRVSEQEIEESGVDGLLLLGVANDAYLTEVARGQLPMVALDYRTVAAPCDYIVVNNEAAAARAVEHLAGLGHRRIAYFDGFSTDTLLPGDPAIDTSDVVERREGYLQAMQRTGFSEYAKVFGVPAGNAGAGAAAAVEFMKNAAQPPTAILAYHTGSARVLFAALEKKGLRVPEDCSLAAVAGASDTQIGSLTCTCNRVRFTEMGQRGVELLAERRANGRPGEPLVTKIGSDFVLGNTACQKS